MNRSLFRDTVTLKIHLSDNTDYTAEYAEYVLSSVRAVERIGTTPEMIEKNAVDVYFFPSFSECRNEDGNLCPLPDCGYGDCAVFFCDGKEKTMRVSYTEKHDGLTENTTHVRIRLE